MPHLKSCYSVKKYINKLNDCFIQNRRGIPTHWKQTLHMLTQPLCKSHLFPNSQLYIVITLNHCILPNKSYYLKTLFDLGCTKKGKCESVSFLAYTVLTCRDFTDFFLEDDASNS